MQVQSNPDSPCISSLCDHSWSSKQTLLYSCRYFTMEMSLGDQVLKRNENLQKYNRNYVHIKLKTF